MLYLLDANVLITASNSYYAIDQVPEFWEWLGHQGREGRLKVPVEIMDEILDGRRENDLLYDWIRDDRNSRALVLMEEADPTLVRKVITNGDASDLSDDEIEQIGRDPFLIAYAMADAERIVVTTEVSKPSKTRQNRKVPDVCRTLSVRCCDTFGLNRALGFRTSWKQD